MTFYPMYIDGHACESASGVVRNVVNPASGEILGQIPMGCAEDVDRAVKAALREAPVMEDMSVFDRAAMLMRIADAIDAHREQIARIMTAEHGKPYSDALGEMEGSASWFRDAAEQVKWMELGTIPAVHSGKTVLCYRKPLGVVGIITPWNAPIGCPSCYYIPYILAAGNTLVWNPATTTAAVASALMPCFEEAGVPAGVINLVIGSGEEVGDAIVTHKDVAALGFTGSTEVGRTISNRANGKHLAIELGGNGPSIVFKDADLELTATELMAGAFGNAGQVCTSTERVLVDDAVADELVSILRRKIGDYRLGDPFDPHTTMGPMHKLETVEIVKAHIQDALDKGAELVCGGKTMPGAPTPNYIEPTILDHVSRNAILNREETFGPVLPLLRFKSESELPDLIADSDYRLFAALFTNDLEKALGMAKKMKFGAININSASSYWEPTFPAGGGAGGSSGHGRSGGKWSIEEFSETRCITLNLRQ